MLDLCIVDSWLLYRATNIADCSIPLAEFKLDVALELIKKQTQMTNIYNLHGAIVHSARTECQSYH